MDREYSVKYQARRRDPSPDERYERRTRRREYDHDHDANYNYNYDYEYGYDDRKHARGYEYRDDRDRRAEYLPPPAPMVPVVAAAASTAATRTTYEVARDRDRDRYDDDGYAKRGNVVVLDGPRSDFEVLKPSKQADGTYVVDLNRPRREYDDGRSGIVGAARGASYYDLPPTRDPRIVDREVIMYDRERDRRARTPTIVGPAPPSPPPPTVSIRSAMRGGNHTPPEEWARRRRSHSVGFFREEIRGHDVTERKHERPGREAAHAGRYLRHYDDDSYMDLDHHHERERERERRHHHRRRRDSDRDEDHHPDYHDPERRVYTEQTVRQYDSEAVRRVEDTDTLVSREDDRDRKRSRSRRRRHHHHHHHHRRDEDDEDYRHEDVVETRRYTKYVD